MGAPVLGGFWNSLLSGGGTGLMSIGVDDLLGFH